ncbi:MAG: hypothetical protein ABEN55_02300 [Bradymonadaceae bacterium]
MDASSADFLELKGLLLPDRRLVWERVRATSELDGATVTKHSPVQAVQVGTESNVVARHALPVEPINQPNHPNVDPIQRTERVQGVVPLAGESRVLAIRVDGDIVAEYDIPRERPKAKSSQATPKPEGELAAADRVNPDLDVRIIHPKAQRRYPLAPVLFEALVFVGDELMKLSDETIHWFVDHQKTVSGRRALWSDPTSGRHAIHVMVDYHGETVVAETSMTVRSEFAQDSGSIQRTGT